MSPLLMGGGGIEEAFNRLFLIKLSNKAKSLLSEHMASLPTLLQYNYNYLLSNKCESKPTISVSEGN